jgi:hypothetical protein
VLCCQQMWPDRLPVAAPCPIGGASGSRLRLKLDQRTDIRTTSWVRAFDLLSSAMRLTTIFTTIGVCPPKYAPSPKSLFLREIGHLLKSLDTLPMSGGQGVASSNLAGPTIPQPHAANTKAALTCGNTTEGLPEHHPGGPLSVCPLTRALTNGAVAAQSRPRALIWAAVCEPQQTVVRLRRPNRGSAGMGHCGLVRPSDNHHSRTGTESHQSPAARSDPAPAATWPPRRPVLDARSATTGRTPARHRRPPGCCPLSPRRPLRAAARSPGHGAAPQPRSG